MFKLTFLLLMVVVVANSGIVSSTAAASLWSSTEDKNAIAKQYQVVQKFTPDIQNDLTVLPDRPKAMPPSVVHLRIQIDSIQIYRDHDTGFRADGEWHLYGVVSCCGGAANSNMPTRGFSFKAPGQPEGEIDTPDGRMNDVTGEYAGMWGTVETVNFNTVYQDIDVDNTNPLTEIQLDFFGVEDDSLSPGDLPNIPNIPGTSYDDYARIITDSIVYLNNLNGADDLGKVHKVFTKANNYGVGSGALSSDIIYQNIWYKTQQASIACGPSGTSKIPMDCSKKDWPDFPEYIINYRIFDREQRCTSGFEYNYATGVCKGIIIQ